MIGRALAVIGQHFDDPAIHHPPVPASVNHAFQFSFQRTKLSDLCLHGGEVFPGQRICTVTGSLHMIREPKQVAYLRQFKSELPGVPDEGKPTNFCVAIETSPARRARCRRHEAFGLIEANGGDLDARAPRDGSDCVHNFPLDSPVTRECR